MKPLKQLEQLAPKFPQPAVASPNVSSTAFLSVDPDEVEPAVEEPIPDLIDPVEGIRSWVFDLASGFLSPLNGRAAPWAPGDNTATCHPGSAGGHLRRPHPSPSRDCSCGFYSLRVGDSISLLENWTGAVPYVGGTVQGWGKVLEYSGGWRAEKVRVTGIVDPCAMRPWLASESSYHLILDHLAVTYGVPILTDLPSSKKPQEA